MSARSQTGQDPGNHQRVNRALRKDRKKTQRDRIVAAMIDAVARDGYAATTIANVVATAGVSRPTFYEYFTDKQDAFVVTAAGIHDQLASEVGRALEDASAETATHALAGALTSFALARRPSARVLLEEATRAGARGLDVRDRGITAIARLLDARHRAPASAAAPDLPARALIGGIYRLLASPLRDGEPPAAILLEELEAWIDRYALSLREHRWRTLRFAPSTEPAVAAPAAPTGPRAPRRGQGRLSRVELAENHRQRIILAAASLAEEKGYPATTVTDLTRRAGVDNRAFYRLFTDKQEAFQALHELLFREIMAVTASGFLAGESWPERVWEAAGAFARYLEKNPTLAYAAFVDSHAGSIETVRRVEQLVGGFTIFLQEGYRHATNSQPPSPLALQAIAATVFELSYMQVRERRIGRLSGLVPHMTFICLAPFIGARASNEFIDVKLAAHR
jgi:AcrR family transcriptional regulator